MTVNDRHKPRFHFSAPQNWLNDPNGLVQWQGRYHLFYQHNPGAAVWGDMHWGHASTTDFLHWEHHPLAMFPDQPYDRDGVYSGIAIKRDDDVLFLYTGVSADGELPCLAHASDELLLQPTKDNLNPLFGPPENIATTIFRDHAVIRHGDHWVQVIGSGIEGHGGNCMTYRSDNLLDWDFVGPLVDEEHHPEIGRDITGWECPDFYQLGDIHALVISQWNGDPIGVWSYTGDFDGERFVPQHSGTVDAGSCFYAPQSFADDLGRRIMIGWLKESRPDAHCIADGWSGAMSLPREMVIRRDGTLGSRLLLDVLERFRFSPAEIVQTALVTREIDARSLAIRLSDIKVATTIDVLRSPDGHETTRISIDPVSGSLVIDSTQSSAHPDIAGERVAVEVGPVSEALIIVDRSIVEVFCDVRCHTVRVYPESPDATGITIVSNGQPTFEIGSIDGRN